MPAFPTPQHISELLHETHHRAAPEQHALHKEENVVAQWHIVSSPHLIILGLIHPCHSKRIAIVSLNSWFIIEIRKDYKLLIWPEFSFQLNTKH